MMLQDKEKDRLDARQQLLQHDTNVKDQQISAIKVQISESFDKMASKLKTLIIDILTDNINAMTMEMKMLRFDIASLRNTQLMQHYTTCNNCDKNNLDVLDKIAKIKIELENIQSKSNSSTNQDHIKTSLASELKRIKNDNLNQIKLAKQDIMSRIEQINHELNISKENLKTVKQQIVDNINTLSDQAKQELKDEIVLSITKGASKSGTATLSTIMLIKKDIEKLRLELHDIKSKLNI